MSTHSEGGEGTRATFDSCRSYIKEQIFPFQDKDYQKKFPKWPGGVGLEVEMFPLSQDEEPPGLVPLQGAGGVAALLGEKSREMKEWQATEEGGLLFNILMEQGDLLSFEPGGQVEISTIPYPCLSDAVRRLREVQEVLDQALAKKGWEVHQIGANPWHDGLAIGLQMPKPRYQAMDHYFGRIGPFGRMMMRQTCTIQVCLDFGYSEELLVQRFLVGQLLAPYATAIFANSPFIPEITGDQRTKRAEIWQRLDPSHTGFPDLEGIVADQSRDACIEAYWQFLQASDVVFMEGLAFKVPPQGFTFGQWLKEGYGGDWPTMADFATQVSLMFPEVRPRGFLELRSIDAQAREWQNVPAAFYTGLLYDQENLQHLFDWLVAGRQGLARRMKAAIYGLKDEELRSGGQKIMAMAVEGFGRLPSCFRGEGIERALEVFYDSYTARGLTPADELVAHVRSQGRALPRRSDLRSLAELRSKKVHF